MHQVRTDPGLAAFNARPDRDAEPDLLACCAAPAFARAVLAGRPYPGRSDLAAAVRAAVAGLSWPRVLEALAAHPRIGDRPAGAGREASWSRREQSGVGTADERVRAALAAGNRAYEDRFGHVFLIRATGLTAERMLAELDRRLANDHGTEQAAVREELAGIAWLRVERLLGR